MIIKDLISKRESLENKTLILDKQIKEIELLIGESEDIYSDNFALELKRYIKIFSINTWLRNRLKKSLKYKEHVEIKNSGSTLYYPYSDFIFKYKNKYLLISHFHNRIAVKVGDDIQKIEPIRNRQDELVVNYELINPEMLIYVEYKKNINVFKKGEYLNFFNKFISKVRKVLNDEELKEKTKKLKIKQRNFGWVDL